MKNDKVLIEKFKGFEIYYDKEQERFVSDKKRFDIHFESRTLWEMKGHIKESQTEEIDEYAYMKSGYFGKSIAKIHLMTTNKATKRGKYKTIEDSNDGYDVGKIHEDQDIPKMYEINEKNTALYDELIKLQTKIKEIEEQQEIIVKKLS